MKILDCTLRDGGYYTNWDFDITLVKSMILSLIRNGVDIIELGYKSPKKGGPFRKCNDGFINQFLDYTHDTQMAFMIDAKDFISGESVNYGLLDDCIKHRRQSPFSLCRLAIKINEVQQSKLIAKYLIDKGYTVYINLMCISLLKESQIALFVTELQGHAHGLYFADSFGNLQPSQVKNICKLYRELTSLPCGIHCHDNQSLAFANCLQAIDSGFDIADGTVCGMGRGVGNARKEQLLLHKNSTISSGMVNIVNKFQTLQRHYKWGYNSLYMMGGMNHIHPLYLQDLTASNLTNLDKLEAAKKLFNNTKYDKELLRNYKDQKAVVVIPARYKSTRFPGKPLAKINGKPMILHVAEKAEQAVGKNSVYVATENEIISEIVKAAGYHVVLTSDNCATGTDRIAEASLEIDADIFVNVQGDEPMIDPQDILRAIQCKKDSPDAVVNCMSKINADENYNDKKIPKVVCNKENYLLYASRNALPGSKSGRSENVKKQVCIYAFGKDELIAFHRQGKKSPLEYQEDIEILRFVENGIPVKMLEVSHVSYAVDYPEDIKVIEDKLNENS